jgi:hypothetical protein
MAWLVGGLSAPSGEVRVVDREPPCVARAQVLRAPSPPRQELPQEVVRPHQPAAPQEEAQGRAAELGTRGQCRQPGASAGCPASAACAAYCACRLQLYWDA